MYGLFLAFIVSILPSILCFHTHRQSLYTTAKFLYSRKDLFFDIVESELKERHTNSQDLSRIFKFCEFAREKVTIPRDIIAPFQDVITEYIEGLTAKPWWDSQEFVWSEELERKSGIIKQELTDVLEREELFRADSKHSTTMGAGWSAIRLQRMGKWIEENVERFPLTTAIIRELKIPLASRGVMFARQLPQTGVKLHSDGRNFLLTAHLGLIVPTDGCSITVANQKRSWEENKVIILDTSFVHETENLSKDRDRYVLILDFWHPELSTAEREALQFIYDSRNKFETGLYEEIDCPYIRNGLPLDVDKINQERQIPINSFLKVFKIKS